MEQAKFKGAAVTVVRAANAGDGEGFDGTKKQWLIKTADGAKKIVLASDVTIDAKAAPAPEDKAKRP